MLINLSELFTLEGKEKIYNCEIEMAVYHAPGGDYRILSKSPVVLKMLNTGGKRLDLEGSTDLSLEIPCDRCLGPVRKDIHLTFVRTLDLRDPEERDTEDFEEQPYLDGYSLDVDQLVCDELILNLPMKVLCREDCKGICNRCGANLNYETCDCDTRSLDPRMAVIQDIFKQFKEV